VITNETPIGTEVGAGDPNKKGVTISPVDIDQGMILIEWSTTVQTWECVEDLHVICTY
jgi:hypothetical protein